MFLCLRNLFNTSLRSSTQTFPKHQGVVRDLDLAKILQVFWNTLVTTHKERENFPFHPSLNESWEGGEHFGRFSSPTKKLKFSEKVKFWKEQSGSSDLAEPYGGLADYLQRTWRNLGIVYNGCEVVIYSEGHNCGIEKELAVLTIDSLRGLKYIFITVTALSKVLLLL